MPPPNYDIAIYRGDSFGDAWSITIPDLSGMGGPASLNEPGVEVRAQVRLKPDAPEPLVTFTVEILDAALRKVRPRLTPAQTASLSKDGVWDLQVTKGTAFARTVLGGKAKVGKDATRP